MYFTKVQKNKNGKSKSCLEMSNSFVENARISKFENVCFCGHRAFNSMKTNYQGQVTTSHIF